MSELQHRYESGDIDTPLLYKTVGLVTPESAKENGLTIESPIFISLIQSNIKCCDHCGKEYAPVMYLKGVETQAHHFHEVPEKGGIYFNKTELISDVEQDGVRSGWVALVEPTSKITDYKNEYIPRNMIIGRSESIVTQEMIAYCYGANYRGYEVKTENYEPRIAKPEIIKEGVLIRPNERYPYLKPWCNDDLKHPRPLQNKDPEYSFRVKNGAVYFSCLSK